MPSSRGHRPNGHWMTDEEMRREQLLRIFGALTVVLAFLSALLYTGVL